jgi:hypothetical protein
MELEPEVHSHPHKVGHKWLDIVLASSALLLSITSIFISVQNESNMRRLVTANSWPYIALNHGNLRNNGEAVIHFDVKNAGIGPAMLEKLVVTYDGKPVATSVDLIQRCCAAAGGLDAIRRIALDGVQGRVFASREETSFLAVARSDADAAVWDKLDVERFKVGMSACYSSVFGEHWITRFGSPAASSVTSCDSLSGPAFDGHLDATGH